MDIAIHKGGWQVIAWVGHAKTSVVIDDKSHISGKRVIAECDSEEVAALMATAPDLLAALTDAEARDEENQSFAEVERLYKSAGTNIKSEFDFEYYRRVKQRTAIAKATGSVS